MNKKSKVTMNGSIVYVLLLLGLVMAVIAQDITAPVVITLPPGNTTENGTNATAPALVVVGSVPENTTENTTSTVVVVGKAEQPAEEQPEEQQTEETIPVTPANKVSVAFREDGKRMQVDVPAELEPYTEKLTAETATALEQQDDTEGEFIVAFQDTIKQSKKEKLLAKGKDVRELGTFKGAKLTTTIKDAKALLHDPDVKYVELEQDVALSAQKEGPKEKDEIPWGVQEVQAPTAWNETLGEKVKIAVLDSGIAKHKDLKIKGGAAIVGDDYTDTDGHGTQVAGVIAAALDGKGIVGNAPKADLYAIKITEGESGKLSDAIEGLQWAIDNHMDIASMSFGFPSYSQIFKEKVQQAYDQGMVLLASSGNDGEEKILYPAKYSKVVAVGAVDKDLGKADFSNYGDDLELVAPGVQIQTTTLNNGYKEVEGTSFATPHVAGVAALIKSLYPKLTPGQIRQKLRRDAADVELPGVDALTGYGLVQFAFGAENLTEVNDAYQYTIYNVSVEKGENVLTFWKEGYGTIDDVDFQEGEYSIVKNLSGRIVTEDMDVDENQTFQLLSRSIYLFDNFTQNGSTSADGIAWLNGILNSSITKESGDDARVECWDWQDDGIWDNCFANSIFDMGYCEDDSVYLTNICHGKCCEECPDNGCPKTDCVSSSNFYWGAMLGKHEIKKDEQVPPGNGSDHDTQPVTGEIGRSDVDAHYYYNCDGNPTNGQAKSRGFGEPLYHVVDAKEARCTGPTTYRYEGRFTTEPAFVTFNPVISCLFGTECDSLLDEILVFDKDGGIPNPCSGITTTDIAIVNVIPIQVIPDVDMVKDKSGFVVVTVWNKGNVTANATAYASFNGNALSPSNGNNIAIAPGVNASINFTFKPDGVGTGLVVNTSVEVS